MSSPTSSQSSQPTTPTSGGVTALTPSKKVEALLAQFDDSSSDDSDVVRSKSSRPRDEPSARPDRAESDMVGSESDGNTPVRPRNRLAARLLGQRKASESRASVQDTVEAPTGVTAPTSDRMATSYVNSKSESPESSSDKASNIISTRKKRLFERQNTPPSLTPWSEGRSPTASPLFFPSPSAVRQSPSPQSRSRVTSSPSQATRTGRSKFLALVEKHRKERLAKEAAEVAKRAVGATERDDGGGSRRIRGSSPADDSSEESVNGDVEAVQRIQRDTRPTRKASKKALEEMNRETQRMNRNMQLAHQATTKKKITKESLLARFNFVSSVGERDGHLPSSTHSDSSSSAIASDGESGNGHRSTPPTSPIREPDQQSFDEQDPEVKDITGLLAAGEATTDMRGALQPADNTDGLKSEGMLQHLYYQQPDMTVQSPKTKEPALPEEKSSLFGHTERVTIGPVRVSRMQIHVASANSSDSDGDIEIVKDRGLKRKFAAFETLPRRKAKEVPSHIALRSLAHLNGSSDRKRSMNATELDLALRRQARMQALEERKHRIEELRAKGVVIQTAEERERDQQEVENLVERARQEAADIQKREKELAKRDGTYVKDRFEDEEDDESGDDDYEEDVEGSHGSDSEATQELDDVDVESNRETNLVDNEAEETASDEDNTPTHSDSEHGEIARGHSRPMSVRRTLVVSDDEDEDEDENQEAPTSKTDSHPWQLPTAVRTPQSVPRSARKVIPGLQMSDDLPMGLSQAFEATMAGSYPLAPDYDSVQHNQELRVDPPSPRALPVPLLQRLDSVDLVSDSQPSASQMQPPNTNFLPQSQVVPESPRGLDIRGTQCTPSQRHAAFELTQDDGYILSPFMGNRFAETPQPKAPQSTVETVILSQPVEDSPVLQRRGRLQRGRAQSEEDGNRGAGQRMTAFEVMQQAAKNTTATSEFVKKKSEARNIVDEAAEESEDEYAGLGGASDDSGDDEENEEDRRMIDEDTQIGKGDEAKLAGLYADRERERDEKEVSKLLKDITTGALRRKRGVGDDLDLSDEEDAAARRREAKRREFARMRRELLKDVAVGKIAEDKKKEAFLRSIEDHEEADNDDIEDHHSMLLPSSPPNTDSQDQSQRQEVAVANRHSELRAKSKPPGPLSLVSESQLNRPLPSSRRSHAVSGRKPATLAEIRESVSFLIEEPDSQAAMIDLGLSDSDDEPEAYVDLNRHVREAEADENICDEGEDDLGGFIVDDEAAAKHGSPSDAFKKPGLPSLERAPFSERRTKRHDVVDRLSLLRQASSSASSTTKMAFLTNTHGSGFSGVPSLLRRATTNSSLGSVSGRENVSATGVVTNKTERGHVADEKEFVRKGHGGRRNAVNYQVERKTFCEEKMSARAGVMKAGKGKKAGRGFLGGLFRGDTWD